jgi:hypothetical protein
MDTYKAKIKATINGDDVKITKNEPWPLIFISQITNNNNTLKFNFEITDDYRLKCNNEYLELGVTKITKNYSVQYSTDDTYNKTPFSCLFDCFSQRIITFNVTIHQ